jgi:hypothetical protein
MRIGAFSLLSGAGAVKLATGVQPTTFPPETIETFAPRWLEHYDLLYFKLHGLPDQPYWYGDGYITAISAALIEQADLSSVVLAFVANCNAANSKMEQALLKAGCKAVIAGPGINYAGTKKLAGADLLGAHIVKRLKRGEPVQQCLAAAKNDLGLLARLTSIGRDTLEFKLTVGV